MSIWEELLGLGPFSQNYKDPSLDLSITYGKDGLIVSDINRNEYYAINDLFISPYISSTRDIEIFEKDEFSIEYSQIAVSSFLNKSQYPTRNESEEVKLVIPYENFESEIENKLRARFSSQSLTDAPEASTPFLPNDLPKVNEVRSNVIRHGENYLKSPEEYPHLNSSVEGEIIDYLQFLEEINKPLNQERYTKQVESLKKHGRISPKYLNSFSTKHDQRYIYAGESYETKRVLAFMLVASTSATLFVVKAKVLAAAVAVAGTYLVMRFVDSNGTEHVIQPKDFLNVSDFKFDDTDYVVCKQITNLDPLFAWGKQS